MSLSAPFPAGRRKAARFARTASVALLLAAGTAGLRHAAKHVSAHPPPDPAFLPSPLQTAGQVGAPAEASPAASAPSSAADTKSSLFDYIDHLTSADFPAAFDALRATAKDNQEDSALHRLLERWCATAPLEAAVAWSALPAGSARADLLYLVVQHLPAATGLDWARSTLQGEEREAVTSALGSVLVDSDPVTAFGHASEDLEHHSNSAMLSAVARRAIKRDPELAVHELARLPSSGPREVFLLQAISALGQVQPARAGTAALETLASDELRREALKRILPDWRRVASAEMDAWLKTRTRPRDQMDFSAVLADLAIK